MPGLFTVFVTQLATGAPALLAYVIGLVLPFAFWRRFPRPCLLVNLAMAVALAASIVSTLLYAYLPFTMDEFHWHHDQLDMMYTLVGAVSSLVHGIAIAMLLAAVFVGRAASTLPGPPADERARIAATGVDTRIHG